LVDPVWGGGICHIGQVDVTRLLFAGDKSLPSIAALADDLFGVFLVLAFTAESKLVLGLAIWDLVDTEPLIGRSEKARQVALDIFDVVKLGSERIVDLGALKSASGKIVSPRETKTHINDNDLPVGLFLV
jgi:hypothetical protein